MVVELEIRDGDPCWLSPDIWVVPGSNPMGSHGVPTSDEPAFIWARVRNNGDSGTQSVTVKYYWGNPSTAVTRESAHLIGTSQAILNAGETKEVLCVTPWYPEWVNDGQECLIVEIFSLEDPVVQNSNEFFYVCCDRKIAQRNISVIQGTGGFEGAGWMMIPFFAYNPDKDMSHEYEIIAEQTEIGSIKQIYPQLGMKELPRNEIQFEQYGIQYFKPGVQLNEVGKPYLSLKLRGSFLIRFLPMILEILNF